MKVDNKIIEVLFNNKQNQIKFQKIQIMKIKN